MKKKHYRFYGGFLKAQEKYLNKMSARGFRLIRCGKLLYEFEPCPPGRYQYRIEFVAHKSPQTISAHKKQLEDKGYRVFPKNINRNWSIGKLRLRPWAQKNSRLSTNSTTYNRELFIIEKELPFSSK